MKQFVRSPLELLPLHVKRDLAAWLTTGGRHGCGMTYKEAGARLLAEHGVRCGHAALCRFFRRHTKPPAAHTVDAVLSPGGDTLTLTINVRIQK